MGPDGIHPRVLRELVEVLTKPLFIIYQQSWPTREVPADWRLVIVVPIYKKGWKEDLGNYSPVSLTSVQGKVMEWIILSPITWHVQDTHVIRPSQHGFVKGRSCLTKLISFYDNVAFLVDEVKAVAVVCLNFHKAFYTISHSILLEKLAAPGLNGRTLHWVKNRLDGQDQRAEVNGVKSMVFPGVQYWGQFCLISLSMTQTSGLSAPSVSLQATPSWEGVLFFLRAGRLCRRTWTGWMDGLRPAV